MNSWIHEINFCIWESAYVDWWSINCWQIYINSAAENTGIFHHHLRLLRASVFSELALGYHSWWEVWPNLQHQHHTCSCSNQRNCCCCCLKHTHTHTLSLSLSLSGNRSLVACLLLPPLCELKRAVRYGVYILISLSGLVPSKCANYISMYVCVRRGLLSLLFLYVCFFLYIHTHLHVGFVLWELGIMSYILIKLNVIELILFYIF
jgi:hypothetical protein